MLGTYSWQHSFYHGLVDSEKDGNLLEFTYRCLQDESQIIFFPTILKHLTTAKLQTATLQATRSKIRSNRQTRLRPERLNLQ